MLGHRPTSARPNPARVARPALEPLEGRRLLSTLLGDQWTYGSRITYSFMPDGTSVGGTPSVLFQTLNAVTSTSTWQAQFEQAASLWENAANLNLAPVPDGGQPVGINGNQQDDSRFGDIRIGAIPLPSGVLAETFLPPPLAGGGTDAGDILFNSSASWAINNTYDVMTVAAHEFGHALGLGESSVVSSVMYGTYNGVKQSLTSDDIGGIDSIYGTPQYDQFNNNGSHNGSFLTAANITPYITSQSQIALPGLDLTVSGQQEWFVVTVPSSTTGRMTVTMQTSNLSSLEPGLMIYNSSVQLVSQTSSATPGGATISTTLSVQAGQRYYIKDVAAVSGSAGTIGSYGLLVNFGNQTQPPIPPPNTVVLQQPDGGGGVINNVMTASGRAMSAGPVNVPTPSPPVVWTQIGSLSGWVVQMAPTGDGATFAIRAAARPAAIAEPSGPSGAGGGSMGVVPGLATTVVGPMATHSSGETATGPGLDRVAGPSPVVDVVFRATDAALEGWHGHHSWTSSHRKHHR
jgi:hypothetical protein